MTRKTPPKSRPRIGNNKYLNEWDAFEAYDNPYNLTKDEFMLITKTLFYTLFQEVVNNGTIYKLPFSLGLMGVRKKATYGRGAFDYKLYSETGQKYWRKNLHSDRWVGRIKWDIKWLYVMGSRDIPLWIYKFKPCRDFSRYLAKQIKENNTINKYYDY